MTLILNGTDGISDVDGSAATPAVRGTDTNTGIFFPAADTIGFSEGGVEVARITNTAAWSFGSSGTATGTNGQVLTSAGSAAAPTWQTPTVTAPAGTTGQVQINNAGAFGAVGSGTTGQVLTSQGAGAAPVFATPATGALVFLSTVTASNSATVDIETTFNSTYDEYLLVITDLVSVNGSGIIQRLKVGGTYATTGYWWSLNRTASATYSGGWGGTGDAAIGMYLTTNLGTNAGGQFLVHIHSPSNTLYKKMIHWEGVSWSNDPFLQNQNGIGSLNTSTAAMTGIRYYSDSGNIISGTFRLYGIAKS